MESLLLVVLLGVGPVGLALLALPRTRAWGRRLCAAGPLGGARRRLPAPGLAVPALG